MSEESQIVPSVEAAPKSFEEYLSVLDISYKSRLFLQGLSKGIPWELKNISIFKQDHRDNFKNHFIISLSFKLEFSLILYYSMPF